MSIERRGLDSDLQRKPDSQMFLRPCTGWLRNPSRIVLIPQDPLLQDPQFLRTARCGEDGRYEFRSVKPGDYSAFAFSKWGGPLELLDSTDQSRSECKDPPRGGESVALL